MNTMTLLVAIDFSETSMTVLKKALSLSERHNGTVHVLHVIEESWFALEKDIKSIKEHTWKTLSTQFPQLNPKFYHCLQGNLIRELSESAEKINASVVIIGSTGESYMFKDLLVGSTTKNIIRSANLPVLVIKNDMDLSPKRILIPTNFSEHSKLTVHKTAELFPDADLFLFNTYDLLFEGRLRVYGFNENDTFSYHQQIRLHEEAMAKEFINSLNLPNEKISLILEKGPLSPDLLLEITKSRTIDMISLHTTGEISFFAFDLLEEADHDVLIFKI
jgi:nucleotide-binding universal stress UspA family protein